MPWTPSEQQIIEEMGNNIKEIKKLLNGNGEIGICEQVRALAAKSAANRDNIARWMKVALLALIIALLLLGWHIATGEMKDSWPTILKIWTML